LDQNITYPPTAGTPTEGILTLQEEDAEDTPNNHLLCTLTTEPSNYEEQITEQEIRQMPVTPKAKLGGIGTAVEALPVQPYKIDQKCTLAPSNNILVDPDANECHSQLKMVTPTTITHQPQSSSPITFKNKTMCNKVSIFASPSFMGENDMPYISFHFISFLVTYLLSHLNRNPFEINHNYFSSTSF
jgi:hypothetical protein